MVEGLKSEPIDVVGGGGRVSKDGTNRYCGV